MAVCTFIIAVLPFYFFYMSECCLSCEAWEPLCTSAKSFTDQNRELHLGSCFTWLQMCEPDFLPGYPFWSPFPLPPLSSPLPSHLPPCSHPPAANEQQWSTETQAAAAGIAPTQLFGNSTAPAANPLPNRPVHENLANAHLRTGRGKTKRMPADKDTALQPGWHNLHRFKQ